MIDKSYSLIPLSQNNKVFLIGLIITALFAVLGYLGKYWFENTNYSNYSMTAKEKCHNLIGKYALRERAQYIFTSEEFTNEKRIRATAIDGTWTNLKCESSGDTYELIGLDTTRHKIEYKLENGDFKHIGYGEASYKSKVTILKDGTLGVRRIVSKERNLDRSYVKPKYKEEYKNAFDTYDEYRKKVHLYHVTSETDKKISDANRRSTPCITLFGLDNSETVLAFACNNYTRTMKRVAM